MAEEHIMKIWSAAEAGSVKLKIPAGRRRACATCVGPFGAASGGTCKGLIGVWSVPMLEGAAPGAARPVSVSIATVALSWHPKLSRSQYHSERRSSGTTFRNDANDDPLWG